MVKIFLLLMILTNFAIANESGFDEVDAGELTDAEQIEANEFIHQGLNQDVMNENCSQEDAKQKELCENSQTAFRNDGSKTGTALAIIEKMAPMIPVAMSTIFGGSKIKLPTGNKVVNGQTFEKQEDGSFLRKTSDPNDATKTIKQTKTADEMANLEKDKKVKVKDETEGNIDYCVHIPTVIETGVQAFKLLSKDNIEEQFNSTEQAARQKASLIAVRQSHKDLKIASLVQLGGWSTTALCYTAYAAKAVITAGAGTAFTNPDGKLIAKLAASITLSVFYGFKVEAHQERVDALTEIINKFPKAGDCNPHTETTCFCDQENSQQFHPVLFTQKCTPPPFQDRVGNQPFSCVDANGKADNQCLCKRTNSCIGQRLKGGFARLGLSPSSVAPILQGLTPIDQGISSGDIRGIARRNLATAKKTLKRFKTASLPSLKLTPKQKKLAKELTDIGLPNFAAAALAATPPNKAAVAKAAAITSVNSSEEFRSPELKKAFSESQRRYSSSSNAFRNKRKKKKNNVFNPFLFGKKGKGSNNTQDDVVILDDYQRKAAAKAEINRDKGKNIFDIITYRYTMSAWKKFEEQIKKEESENQK